MLWENYTEEKKKDILVSMKRTIRISKIKSIFNFGQEI